MKRSSILTFLSLMDTGTWSVKTITLMKASLRSGGHTLGTIRSHPKQWTSSPTRVGLTIRTQPSTEWLLTYLPQPQGWRYRWNGEAIGRVSQTMHTLN